MTNLREAAQMALNALEKSRVFVTSREKIKHPEGTEWYDERIEALRAALAADKPSADRLAQPEQERDRGGACVVVNGTSGVFTIPLPGKPGGGGISPAPQRECAGTAHDRREWQRLTDEDFLGLTTQQIFAMKFAEAKLKEKNT